MTTGKKTPENSPKIPKKNVNFKIYYRNSQDLNDTLSMSQDYQELKSIPQTKKVKTEHLAESKGKFPRNFNDFSLFIETSSSNIVI